MEELPLFKGKIQALKELPDQPQIFWYPSAGNDFRGPVFLTNHHIDNEERHRGRNFFKPDLFVFNCLGDEVTLLKEKLSGGKVEIWNDGLTRVEALNYQTLSLQDAFLPEIYSDYIDSDHINIPENINEAFYFELVIIGRDYTENQKILYFEHENIDFFNKVILSNFFDVKYLCTLREGCGSGGCKKSIIEYIYKDFAPLFFTDQGFKPQFNILFTDFTNDLFRSTVSNSNIISIDHEYSLVYPKESDMNPKDSIIYKLDYSTQI